LKTLCNAAGACLKCDFCIHLFHARTIENITRLQFSDCKASAAIQFSSDSNPFFLNLVMEAHAQLFVFGVPSSPRVQMALWSKNQLKVSMSNSSVENTIIALENTMAAMAEIRVMGRPPDTTISYSKWLQVACEMGKGLLQQLDPFVVDINTSRKKDVHVVTSEELIPQHAILDAIETGDNTCALSLPPSHSTAKGQGKGAQVLQQGSIEIPVLYSRLPSSEKKKARECLAKG
jgi:hypothetical protein